MQFQFATAATSGVDVAERELASEPRLRRHTKLRCKGDRLSIGGRAGAPGREPTGGHKSIPAAESPNAARTAAARSS